MTSLVASRTAGKFSGSALSSTEAGRRPVHATNAAADRQVVVARSKSKACCVVETEATAAQTVRERSARHVSVSHSGTTTVVARPLPLLLILPVVLSTPLGEGASAHANAHCESCATVAALVVLLGAPQRARQRSRARAFPRMPVSGCNWSTSTRCHWP